MNSAASVHGEAVAWLLWPCLLSFAACCQACLPFWLFPQLGWVGRVSFAALDGPSDRWLWCEHLSSDYSRHQVYTGHERIGKGNVSEGCSQAPEQRDCGTG